MEGGGGAPRPSGRRWRRPSRTAPNAGARHSHAGDTRTTHHSEPSGRRSGRRDSGGDRRGRGQGGFDACKRGRGGRGPTRRSADAHHRGRGGKWQRKSSTHGYSGRAGPHRSHGPPMRERRWTAYRAARSPAMLPVALASRDEGGVDAMSTSESPVASITPDFRVMSYNLLAESNVKAAEQFPSVPDWILDARRRLRSVQAEIEHWDPDVLCLQEVDCSAWERTLAPWLRKRGYDSVYAQRSGTDKQDGCATCWKAHEFNALHTEPLSLEVEGHRLLVRGNVAAIAVLQRRAKGSSQRLLVSSAHLLFNPRRGDIKLAQLSYLFAHVAGLAGSNGVPTGGPAAPGAAATPVLLCGDYNFTPDSALYYFVRSGDLDIGGVDRRLLSGQEALVPGGRRTKSRFRWPKWRKTGFCHGGAGDFAGSAYIRPPGVVRGTSTEGVGGAYADETRRLKRKWAAARDEEGDPEGHTGAPRHSFSDGERRLSHASVDQAAAGLEAEVGSTSSLRSDTSEASEALASSNVPATVGRERRSHSIAIDVPGLPLFDPFPEECGREGDAGWLPPIHFPSGARVSHSLGLRSAYCQAGAQEVSSTEDGSFREITLGRLALASGKVFAVAAESFDELRSAAGAAGRVSATGGAGGDITSRAHGAEKVAAGAPAHASGVFAEQTGEPAFTTYHDSCKATVDYLFFTAPWEKEVASTDGTIAMKRGGLEVCGVAEMLHPAILAQWRTLPTAEWGSDHMALVADFAFM